MALKSFGVVGTTSERRRTTTGSAATQERSKGTAMPIGLIVSGAAFFLVVGALGFIFVRDFARLRILSRTTFDDISTISEGSFVVVRGTVTTKNTHRAPLSEASCAWFSSQAKAPRSSRNGRQFHTVEDLRSDTPFVVRDSTGSIRIDPQLPFAATESTQYYWSSDAPLQFGARRLVLGQRVPLYPKQEGTLTPAYSATPAARFRAQALYDEHTVKEGDDVVCAGVATHGPNGMVLTSRKRGRGTIAAFGETRIRKDLKAHVMLYGVALGIIGTLFLNASFFLVSAGIIALLN